MTFTAYRWELRKLASQVRTYLGLGLLTVLPLIFVPFVISFPAGLIVYWITTNIWTIGQQYTVQKIIPAPVVATPAEVAAAKPPPPPPRSQF